MPATINGIGTTYYGKKNLRVHPGQCEFCHREVGLREYEAIHWVVVLFIPLIPLGRKKILDDCPTCGQHRAMPLAEWEKLREQTVGEATEAFAKDRDDPLAAFELVEALATVRQFDEADKLAEGIQDRFDDDAQTQFHMGQWHDFRNRKTEAAECFRRALQLQGDHVQAKRAVTYGMVADDQPEQARALMASPPEISVSMDPTLYLELGRAYQRTAQHGEALAVFRQVLEAAPELKSNNVFRKLVRASEKIDPAGARVLPPKTFFSPRRVLVAAAVLGIVAVVLFANYYVSTHRTLHVVNGFGVPLKVALDGRPPITVAPHSWKASSIAEGSHRAVVKAGGEPLGTDEFEVATDYWRRWFDDPVFVLNAGGGAAIVWEQAIYASPPIDGSSIRVEAGTRFVAFDDVDFPFAPFPPEIQLAEGKPVTRTRVDRVAMPVAEIFYLEDEVTPEARLRFAETHLSLAPNDKGLLQAYLRGAAAMGQLDRARKLIESGLDARPVRVEWHRSIQALATSDEQIEGLRGRYRKWLKEDPNDASILYLLARLEPRSSAAVEYLDAAIAADPTNPYPWFARGFHRAAAADFAAAKTDYAKAVELRPDDEDFVDELRNARLALGECADLEREARERLREQPHQFAWHVQLLEVLAADDKPEQARAAHAEFVKQLRNLPEVTDQVKQVIAIADVMHWYFDQDFRRILEYSEQSPDDFAFLRYQSHLALGEYDNAARELAAVGEPLDPFSALQLGIGWRMAGDEPKSEEWIHRACEQFDQGQAERRQIAALLREPAAATPQSVGEVALQPHEKAIVLIALAQQSRENKDAFLAVAEKLNFSRLFAYQFLARAIAATRGQK